MDCNIIWNKLSFSEWENNYKQVTRPNLLQSYAYARTLHDTQGHTARQGVIHIDGRKAGILQITEISAFRSLLHAVIIDRGPLWFEGYGSPEHFKALVLALNKTFPRRLGRKRRFIPETYDRNALVNTGFKRQGQSAYQTIWLDLRRNEEQLLKDLNKKWRNTLRKAEKSGLDIEWDDRGKHLPWLLNVYETDKQDKSYKGAPAKFISTLAKYTVPEKNMIIGRALKDEKPVAAILLLVHGSGATYQIGWTSPDGRETAAHYLLLWDALEILKNRGVKDFDLGGVNDESAKTVKKFKQNMGGELVRLAGLYS